MRNSANERFAIVVWLVLSIVVAMIVINIISDMEHYNRAIANPLTVTATVYDHKEQVNSESAPDYESYVKYTVKGRNYTARYEYESNKNELTPIGQQVVVQVSPENPAKMIDDLGNSGNMLLIISGFLVFAEVLSYFYPEHAKRIWCDADYRPSFKTIQCDVVKVQLLQCHMLISPILTAGLWILRSRYSKLLGSGGTVLAGISSILCLWFVATAGYVCYQVYRGRLKLERDALLEKKIIYDSDGNSYELHYRNIDSGKEWKVSVNRRKYDCTKKGEIVEAVYLMNRKKPVIFYDYAEENNDMADS